MSDEMTAMDLCDFYVGSQGRESPMANETVRVNYKDFMAIRTDLAAAKERAVKIDVQMSQRDDLLDELTTKLCNANETCDTLRTESEAMREALTFLKSDHLRLLARYFDASYANDLNTEVQDDLRAWADMIDAALAGQKDTTDDK